MTIKRVYEGGSDSGGPQLVGRWRYTLTGPDGAVKDERVGTNVVCTNGKEFLASFLASAAAAASTFTCRYVAIGTDSTAETAANTALGTELARVSGVVSYASGCIYRVTATFAAGTGTGAIAEYGIFSSSTGGTLLNRDTESVINKGASDTLTATCELTIS
jgi:hypothetical protein